MTSSSPSENVTAEGQALLSAPRRLEFVIFEPPAIGQAIPIAPGVRWCRIPLPIDLDHINVWLIDHEDGCVAVDTGMAAPAAEEAWQALEAEALRERPLRGVFVTHLHPDHFGLARWLQQRYSVPVWMSARTLAQIREFLAADPADVTAAAQAFFREHGLADQTLPQGVSPARFARMTSGVPHASSIADGETIGFGAEQWTALETNGHAEGHLCLHNAAAQVLISGDQVLPTISSNIGFTWRSSDSNPLGSYLASLDRLYTLSRETLVLPSHGLPFRGLKARIEDLRAHHLRQLEAVELACDEPKTALEVLPTMFRRSLHGMHFYLAMAEALAHLEYLVHAGRLRKERDREGVTRFARLRTEG